MRVGESVQLRDELGCRTALAARKGCEEALLGRLDGSVTALVIRSAVLRWLSVLFFSSSAWSFWIPRNAR